MYRDQKYFSDALIFKTSALMMCVVLAIFMVGCGDDDDDDAATNDDDDDDAGPPDATTVTVDPAAGATIPSNQQFTLTFDNGVTAATVNGTAATGSGLNWTASPALAQGSATLNVEWTNRSGSTGSQAVGPYTVSDPDVTATNGTVADGAADVDPAPINAGGLRFDFDDNVPGAVLNWIVQVLGEVPWIARINLTLLIYAAYLSYHRQRIRDSTRDLEKRRKHQRTEQRVQQIRNPWSDRKH